MSEAYMEMTMDELLAAYNEKAEELGQPTAESFNSLKAARAAYKKLNKPAKAPKASGEVTARGPRQGVGTFAKGLLLEGMTNKEVLAEVLEQFPDAKTTLACIAYYKTKLIAAGQLESTRKAKEVAVEEVEDTEVA